MPFAHGLQLILARPYSAFARQTCAEGHWVPATALLGRSNSGQATPSRYGDAKSFLDSAYHGTHVTFGRAGISRFKGGPIGGQPTVALDKRRREFKPYNAACRTQVCGSL